MKTLLPAFFLTLCITLTAEIVPAEWYFGVIGETEQVKLALEVRNSLEGTLTLNVVNVCGCLTAQPMEISVPQDESRSIHLTFDPSGYAGTTSKLILFKSNDPDLDNTFFEAKGYIAVPANSDREAEECAACKQLSEPKIADRTSTIDILYFYSPGCRSCEAFLAEEVPQLEEEFGVGISVHGRSILESEIFDEYQKTLTLLGEHPREFPALVVEDRVLQGDREIDENLGDVIRRIIGGEETVSSQAPEPDRAEGEGDEPVNLAEKAAPLPVLAAGLLDGINPCAFTVLIFLLSYLTLVGRSRRQILLIGVIFTLSVFVTYLLIGFGLFQALRYASSFPIISAALRWILVGVLFVFAGLSLYDANLIRLGRAKDMILQLPGALKKRIHATIRTRVRMTAIAGSAVVMGFLVSVFELACTGQVYFPTLVYLVRMKRQIYSVVLLLIYNFGFIIPLIVVFTLVFLGFSSERLTQIFQTHMGKVKVALAGLFILLAVFTLLT